MGEATHGKPKTWKKKSPHEIKKMGPQERSRYMAYEEPSKDIQDQLDNAHKRVKNAIQTERSLKPRLNIEDELERHKHSNLIGQLKAAEARNRIRVMRLQYQAMRAHEVKHLIACQPTSLKALRLEALVPPYIDNNNPGDQLDKLDRARVESILEDDKGITTNRKLD
uniref:LKAAEAR motif-containing protein 1 n=1 Tax=Ciona savignyi TaxID=51511 RepID=H2YB69_CIOSA